jgi:hypothetical protein
MLHQSSGGKDYTVVKGSLVIIAGARAYFYRSFRARIARRFRAYALLAASFAGSAFSKENPPHDGYELLRSVQSPVDLITPHLPSAYTAQVSLTGNAVDEMGRTLEKLKLGLPRYEEVYDARHRFYLNLSNADYPLETRECITGILNPIEMMDIIITSALKYRDDNLFSIMTKETNIVTSVETDKSSKTYRIHLTPRGKYFSYAYEDEGVFARETWLTGLTLIMDSATHRVNGLTLNRYARRFDASQREKPPMDSLVTRYAFGYRSYEGAVFPADLTIWVNGTQTLSVLATYRTLEPHYTVFDTRKICSFDAAGASCITMRYGEYRLNAVPQAVSKPIKPSAYAKTLEKAARLSREALQSLREGNIETSMRICRKIVDQCPETPQAVEARRLLSGLPTGK